MAHSDGEQEPVAVTRKRPRAIATMIGLAGTLNNSKTVKQLAEISEKRRDAVTEAVSNALRLWNGSSESADVGQEIEHWIKDLSSMPVSELEKGRFELGETTHQGLLEAMNSEWDAQQEQQRYWELKFYKGAADETVRESRVLTTAIKRHLETNSPLIDADDIFTKASELLQLFEQFKPLHSLFRLESAAANTLQARFSVLDSHTFKSRLIEVLGEKIAEGNITVGDVLDDIAGDGLEKRTANFYDAVDRKERLLAYALDPPPQLERYKKAHSASLRFLFALSKETSEEHRVYLRTLRDLSAIDDGIDEIEVLFMAGDPRGYAPIKCGPELPDPPRLPSSETSNSRLERQFEL